jgi:F420-0:gamma-glutamyl ligase-like protein
LVIVNAFVGGMIGMERTIIQNLLRLNLVLASKQCVYAIFGITKAITIILRANWRIALAEKFAVIWVGSVPIPLY